MGIVGDKIHVGLGRKYKPSKEEVFESVFWFKLIFSLIYGLVAGIMEFTGYPIILVFFVGLFLLGFLYYSKVLGVEDESYTAELFMEGTPNGIALFLLSWILTYTFIQWKKSN